ncbi:Alpha-protein kinase 2 [Myotis brandtii]|uniref:Alpha-protein kinase 2 n=1 Tax=Myotis brandtii TaxID=109478 RepID=S7PXP5_MYOBR|nr:Alpha-protein kinase 2 [Myotis brandtii]
MTDSGGPQRRTLCFLSTLLSQKVPEKSDTVLRCIISGQPKPEVTWYKNGQTIEEGDIISSYEFFENQYIHVLHLYGCTQNDAATYQISAKNSYGMICCSASIEVECASKNTQLTPNPQDDGDTGWKRETQTHEQKSTSRIDEDVYRLGTVQSKLSKLTDGALNHDEDLHSSHQNPKAQKYISASLSLSEAATSIYPGDRATVDEQVSPQVSSTDSDSDYELCPEITLTYTEEFSDDDLEYLECSDVMTDYSNAVWQRHLEGTECIFLLESDDEEVEISKYCLGECEPFFSEMGCGPPVSDNTGQMLASAGFCGDHSRSQGVRVRRLRASTPSPPAPHTGMTLTLGSHEDGTSTVTEQGRYKRPTTSAENDYPGIQGETRDSHRAGAEPAGDNLLTMDKAVTPREVQCLSGELEKPGMNQSLETVPEDKVGEKDLQSKRSSEKPARARRPGLKGKPKKRSPSLKDSAAEGTLNHLPPQESAKHPRTQSDKEESSHATGEAPDLKSQVHAEGALLLQAEQDAKRLQTPPGAPPQEGSPNSEGEGVQVNDFCETSWAPDQSDHPQEKPTTLTATPECLQVTRENGNTPAGTIATKVHSAKYLPVCIAENSHVDGPEESSAQVAEGNIFQLPSSVQRGHVLNGSTTESPKELGMAPSGPGVHVCAPPPPEGDSCSTAPPQIGNRAGDKSQTVDRADHRSLGEHFQEKGSETQRIQPESPTHQGSLSEDNFQESWPMTSAAQGETDLLPMDQSLANSMEERSQSSGLGTSVSVVTKAAMEDDSQAVNSAPPLSQSPLEGSKESGPAPWEAGNKPKTMTVEAPVSEVWPPSQLTASECEESEAGAKTPAGVWAVAASLKEGAAGPELDPPEPVASAASPQAEAGSALAKDGEIYEGRKPARRAHWSYLSSRYLSQPRFLGSSVDPVDEGVTDWPSEASKTGRQENVSNVSQSQEENQPGVAPPAFFKQFLPRPEILESSVDPIDEMSVVEWARVETQEPSDSTLGVVREESQLDAGSLGQRVEVQPIISPGPFSQQSGETIPSENSTNRSQDAGERGEAEHSQHDKAKGEVQPAVLQVPCLDEGGVTVPGGCSGSQAQEGRERSLGEAEQSKKDAAGAVSPTLPLSSAPAVLAQASVGVDTDNTAGQIHGVPENHLVEPRNHQHAFSDSKEKGERESECGKHLPSPSGLTQLPFTSSPEGNITDFSISHKIEEPEIEAPQSGETKPTRASSSPAVTLALVSGERASETAPHTLQDPWHLGPTPGRGRKSGEGRPRGMAAQTGRSPVPAWEEAKKKQEITGSAHLTEGVKRKILSKVAALRLRLEERENTRKNGSFPKKIPKLETSVSCTDENKDPKKPPCKREGKAPVLLRKIQAEMFPDHSGDVRLSCQFAEIHEDSTIWWTKDSKSIAQVQRSAGDNSIVSLTIVQASQKDQGLYYCCIKNSYGKVTAEFNLTTEVLKQLSSHQDIKGCEEIEFSQLIFREDFLQDSYFGDRLRGQIATEELHFGEGVHRKAFRSKVMQGLMPVFQPGHACVLKVHNAVAYGTRNNDELVQRNYNLAAQECYVQNTARHYAKIYAAEAQPLEGFGEVPEIIPIFLIHRPENNIPYATVEEELIGEFVKYSIRDGKEINFLRRDSEAGQKCCTFQHWVYQKTSGCLLVTDMQGVGMKLTDVGIATLAKGYKGFKGNCSMAFIDQFKALHQCNKYCKMLGLKSLQNNNQKQKKPSATKGKSQSNSTTAKKTASGAPADKKT